MRAIAATGLSHALAAYMILVWPVLVRRRYQTLTRRLQEHDPDARMRAYRRTLLHQGAMVLVVMAILAIGAIPASRVGFVALTGGPSQRNMLLAWAQ